jgi:hypothetical protein
MARRDATALRSPNVVEAFKRYIEREEELIDVLQSQNEAERRILGDEWRGLGPITAMTTGSAPLI